MYIIKHNDITRLQRDHRWYRGYRERATNVHRLEYGRFKHEPTSRVIFCSVYGISPGPPTPICIIQYGYENPADVLWPHRFSLQGWRGGILSPRQTEQKVTGPGPNDVALLSSNYWNGNDSHYYYVSPFTTPTRYTAGGIGRETSDSAPSSPRCSTVVLLFTNSSSLRNTQPHSSKLATISCADCQYAFTNMWILYYNAL